jgi:cell division protein FtsL
LSGSDQADGGFPLAPPLQSFKPTQDEKRNESVLSTPLPIPTAPSIIALLIILLSAAVQVQATTTSSLWSVEKWFYAVIAHLMIVGMCSLVLATLAGAVFALFKVPFMKTFSRAYTITVLLVSISMLFVSFSLFKLNSRNRTAASDIAKAKATIAALGDDVTQFQAHMENLNEPGADQSIQINKTATATTDIEKVHEVIRSVMQDTAVIQREYERELAEGGLDDLLNAHRIDADGGLAQSSATLLKLRQTTESYRKRSNATMESIPDKIRSYTFEHTTIETLLDGLQAGLRSGLSKNDRIWNLELEVFDHLESALRFIESSRTRWQAEGEVFIFELDADLSRFNSILEEINRCAEEQDEIRNSAKNSALERLDKLKSKF